VARAFRVLSVCLLAGLCGTAGHAAAQTAESLKPTVVDDAVEPLLPRLTILPEDDVVLPSVKRRVKPNPFAPLGLRQGGITYFPSLGVGGVVTSNGAQVSSNPKAAVGLHLRPAIRFESDWVRHSWDGQADGDFIRYLGSTAIDTMQADASSRFRLDIHHDLRADFDASYRLSQDGASNSEVPNTAIGDRTDHTLNASAAITREFGAFDGRLKLGIERRIFEDVDLSGGGTEDNRDRNTISPSIGARLAYVDPPALKPFIDVTYEPRFHDQKLDRNGLARDSQGVTASLGVTLERGPIWSGEAAIVYAFRDYKDAALKTNAAFGINGNLTWRPTELTSVVMTLATSLDETASATSSGSRTYSGRLDLTHALRENVNLLAGMGVSTTKTEFGAEDTITSKLGVEWQMNPELAWTASYDGTWFKAPQSIDSYNEQRVSTGFVIRR
jgi:hypothetical protein